MAAAEDLFDLADPDVSIRECAHCHEPVSGRISPDGTVNVTCGYCGREDAVAALVRPSGEGSGESAYRGKDRGASGRKLPLTLDLSKPPPKRNEVAFFDALSYGNYDYAAVREVNLTNGIEIRTPLYFPSSYGAAQIGQIVSAAYRAYDDSYFILVRRSATVDLFRFDRRSALQLVKSFADSGIGVPEVTTDEDGRIAVSRRGAGFAAVVLDVSYDLVVTPLAHLSGTEALAAAPTLTPEGLYLDRGGVSSDAVVPLQQAGVPGINVHDIGGGAWQGIFQ